MNNDTKLIVAKALRSTFNEIQYDLLTQSYMDDDFLIQKVREMQETYKVFSKVSGELKVDSREQYDKLLGV